MQSLGLYIHWPFCVSKCPYCDFNSHVRPTIDQAAWGKALGQELAYWGPQFKKTTVDTIFFGGGTPSLMEPETVAYVLEIAAKTFHLTPRCEITLEANPNSSDIKKFHGFKQAGINRVSIGIQSFDTDDLKFLGRAHDRTLALQAIEAAGKIFENYSFDLIYTRPQQTAQQWCQELEAAIPLMGPHASLYQLSIEPNTAFYQAFNRGDFSLPEEDESIRLFEETRHIMAKAGRPAYEVSNFSRPGYASQHNLRYWRSLPYLGIGPGAHSRVVLHGNRYAMHNLRAPETWLKQVEAWGHGQQQQEVLSRQAQLEERVMMGLRLEEGINLEGNILEHLEQDFPEFKARLALLEQHQWLARSKTHLRATPQGFLRLNALVRYLL